VAILFFILTVSYPVAVLDFCVAVLVWPCGRFGLLVVTKGIWPVNIPAVTVPVS